MSITIGNVVFESPLMNAACSVAKNLDDIKALATTPVGVITIGSITVEPRTGNSEPRWYDHGEYALNSFGMPNEGLKAYRQHLPEMVFIAHNADKKVSLSVAGFNTEDYVKLAQLASESGVDLLELNLGCPNVQVDGKQKPIASFDTTYMIEIIDAVSSVTNLPLMVKLSPYSNPAELQTVALALAGSNKVSAVVTSNTFPNGYQEENGQPVLAMEYGGVSGRALMPAALGQVRQFRNALPDTIVVIGVGGIETSEDVTLYLNAGASAVQAATLIVREGHGAMRSLAS